MKKKTPKTVVPIQSLFEPTKKKMIIPYCTNRESPVVNQKYLKRPYLFPTTIQEARDLLNDDDYNDDELFYGIFDVRKSKTVAYPVKHQ